MAVHGKTLTDKGNPIHQRIRHTLAQALPCAYNQGSVLVQTGEFVINKRLVPALTCALFATALPVQAQDFPEGPGKQMVTAVCGACHDINRLRVGYTPEGWRTVIRMMQNVETPVPADQWATVTEYLTTNFPERARASRGCRPGPVEAVIKEWPVPTPAHAPRSARNQGRRHLVDRPIGQHTRTA